jgi:biotin transport system ATP-binding protein
MIEVRNLCKYFRTADSGILKALDDVSLSIADGQCVLIAGANGSGKSLLMKLIANLEKPTKGSVETSEDVGLVFQDADAQILADTPLEDVMFGLRRSKKLSKEEAKATALKALGEVGLSEKANSPSHFLSGGEKRRLAVASVMALGRKILILDEVYSNLDYPGVKSVNSLIEKLKKEGLTIIILSHELEKCIDLCERFIVLDKGKLVFDGKTSQALEQDLEKWGVRKPVWR